MATAAEARQHKRARAKAMNALSVAAARKYRPYRTTGGSKYAPHQGNRERERRIRQMNGGIPSTQAVEE